MIRRLYNFIDDRENAWTWLYFHVMPIALFLWSIFTPDYSSFPALRISLLKPHCIVPLVLFAYAYFYQTGYAYYNSLYARYCCIISPDKFIWIKDGVPGSGKSSSALVYAYVLAGKVWRDLCRKYWLYKNNPRKLLRDKVSAANWEEIKSAYLFWKRHPEAIPCLMSNISLMQGDRHVFQLTREHYLQQQRIPYGTVLFGDELDKLFPALSSMTKEERAELEPLRQLAGFTRHFGDFRWIYTRQRCRQRVYVLARVGLPPGTLALDLRSDHEPARKKGLSGQSPARPVYVVAVFVRPENRVPVLHDRTLREYRTRQREYTVA